MQSFNWIFAPVELTLLRLALYYIIQVHTYISVCVYITYRYKYCRDQRKEKKERADRATYRAAAAYSTASNIYTHTHTYYYSYTILQLKHQLASQLAKLGVSLLQQPFSPLSLYSTTTSSLLLSVQKRTNQSFLEKSPQLTALSYCIEVVAVDRQSVNQLGRGAASFSLLLLLHRARMRACMLEQFFFFVYPPLFSCCCFACFSSSLGDKQKLQAPKNQAREKE